MAKDGVAASREREVKLGSDAAFTLPDLSRTAASTRALHPMTLTAHYYDTPDLRLARWGVTLRRRTGGADDAWTLKLPADGAKDELTEPLEASASGPPAGLTALVTGLARAERLRHVATLVTQRTGQLLLDSSGAPVAEVVADAVTSWTEHGDTARWHEVEVEAKSADADLEPVVAALVAAGASRTAQLSKAVRALGSRAAAPGDPPPPAAPGPGDPARLLAEWALRQHTRGLVAQDVRVRLDLDDAVHQMRVSARRLRSALRMLGPLLEPEWATATREELRWLGGALGAARDAEVIAALVQSTAERLPRSLRTPELDAALAGALHPAGARQVALAALDSHRYVALLDRLVDSCKVPPVTEAAERPVAEVAPPLVLRAFERLRRDADRLDPATSPAEHYHRVRVLAKRSRYAAETVAEVYGKPARRFAARMAEVQTVLGDQHDCVVAQEILHDTAAHPDRTGGVGFALGHVAQLLAERGDAAQQAFHDLWPQVRRGRHRRWLDDA